MENEPLPCVAERKAVVYPNSFASGACAMIWSADGLLSMLDTIPPLVVRLEIASPTYWDGTMSVTSMIGSMSTGPASFAAASKHMAAQASNANSLAVSSLYLTETSSTLVSQTS